MKLGVGSAVNSRNSMTQANAPGIEPIDLAELRRIGDLQHELTNVFPSRGSIDWAIRVHRSEFVAARALFEIGGRLMAHPARFKACALEIAARTVRSS